MSSITTHVLDAVLGRPAVGIVIALERFSENTWNLVGTSSTDSDGRCRNLTEPLNEGQYRLSFQTKAYFDRQARKSIYPEITVAIHVDGTGNYHIPLLLSDNSYTTYRGS